MYRKLGIGIAGLTLVFITTLGISAQTETDLLHLISEDELCFLLLKDAKGLVERFKQSSMAEMLKHKGFEHIWNILEEELGEWLEEFREETGFKLEDFIALFDGDVILGIGDLTPIVNELKELGDKIEAEDVSGLIDVFFMGQTKQKPQDAKKYMQKIFEREQGEGLWEVSKEEIEGVELMIAKTESPEFSLIYAQVDELFVLTFSKERVKQIIANKERGRLQRPITDNETFKGISARIEADKSDLILYLNLVQLLKFVDPLVEILEGFIPVEDELNLREIIDSTLDIFGVRNLKGLAMSMGLREEKVVTSSYLATEGAPKGLIKLIGGKRQKLEVPDFIPEDAMMFSCWRWDISGFWKTLKEEVEDICEEINKVIPQVPADPWQFIELVFGLNVEEIIGHLGDQVIFYTIEGEADELFRMPPTLYIFTLKEEEGIKDTVETIISRPGLMELVEEVEYLNKTIYAIGEQDEEEEEVDQRPAFAIFDKKFVFATQCEGLKSLIRRVDKKGPSIADTERFKGLAEGIPELLSSIGFASGEYFGEVIAMYIEMLSRIRELGDEFDPDKLPKKEFFAEHIVGSISYGFSSEEGVFSRSVTQFKPVKKE